MIVIKRAFQPITMHIQSQEDLDHILMCLNNELHNMEHRFMGMLRRDVPDSRNQHYTYIKELSKRLTR